MNKVLAPLKSICDSAHLVEMDVVSDKKEAILNSDIKMNAEQRKTKQLDRTKWEWINRNENRSVQINIYFFKSA